MNPFERINSESDIMISGERYQQLIRAEHDANMLKVIIAETYNNYRTIDRETLKVLYAIFIGEKEEDHE